MTAPAVRVAGAATLDGAPLFGPLDVRLAAGQWTCLLGASGVGKSTVLRLIAGLPTGADFAGTVTASDGAPLAGRVAYMAQSRPALSLARRPRQRHRRRPPPRRARPTSPAPAPSSPASGSDRAPTAGRAPSPAASASAPRSPAR